MTAISDIWWSFIFDHALLAVIKFFLASTAGQDALFFSSSHHARASKGLSRGACINTIMSKLFNIQPVRMTSKYKTLSVDILPVQKHKKKYRYPENILSHFHSIILSCMFLPVSDWITYNFHMFVNMMIFCIVLCSIKFIWMWLKFLDK